MRISVAPHLCEHLAVSELLANLLCVIIYKVVLICSFLMTVEHPFRHIICLLDLSFLYYPLGVYSLEFLPSFESSEVCILLACTVNCEFHLGKLMLHSLTLIIGQKLFSNVVF